MNISSILTSILIISGGMFNLATGRENITMGSIKEEVIRLDLSNPNNLEKFLENINEGIGLSDYENFAYYLNDEIKSFRSLSYKDNYKNYSIMKTLDKLLGVKSILNNIYKEI